VPYKVEPDPDHQGKFRVRNTETGGIKGSNMSKDAAQKQFRLLEGVEHGWTPTNRDAGTAPLAGLTENRGRF
jgi:hypothetical protein